MWKWFVILQCSVEDVADMMAKVTNIATSRIDRLDRVINLLLGIVF